MVHTRTYPIPLEWGTLHHHQRLWPNLYHEFAKSVLAMGDHSGRGRLWREYHIQVREKIIELSASEPRKHTLIGREISLCLLGPPPPLYLIPVSSHQNPVLLSLLERCHGNHHAQGHWLLAVLKET